MPEGMVKWFNDKKGFGFIENKGGPDIFVHFSQIEGGGFRKLTQGDVVEYEIVQGEKGPKAAKVVRKKHTDS
ncbi:MAG: cold-shock protein [Sedimentisphaerales bacterium]|nr:cold-shock protein [Sedimentisphaerales bacterium]